MGPIRKNGWDGPRLTSGPTGGGQVRGLVVQRLTRRRHVLGALDVSGQ